MKRDMLKKLQSRAGETLSETLLSVLVGALALLMLAGAVSAASRVITTSKNKLNDYYGTTETVISQVYSSETVSHGTVAIIPDEDESKAEQVNVRYAVNDEFGGTPVIVYQYVAETGD